MKTISLTGLNKADVLAALYNASKPQGMGFMHYKPEPMLREQAQALLERQTYFDYLIGRVMKVDLSGEELRADLYDRDNGAGAAERVIAELREKGDVNTDSIQRTHELQTKESADQTRERLESKTSISRGVVTLGLADVADHLRAKLPS